MKDTILIIGATGTVGSELVSKLKKSDQNVRIATSKKINDADKVHLNLLTGEGLKEAFDGVSRAFFLSPAGYTNQSEILKPLIQEAQRRGLEKVVLMTALGANSSDDFPLRQAEMDLEKSGLNYNIIRPNWFLQNFHTYWIQGIREQGKILVPAENAKVSFIDSRDISNVAAKLLISDEFNNQAFDLTGPESIDHHEVAAALSAVSGKKIAYQSITPSDLKKNLLAAGVPADYADVLNLIFGFLRQGYNAAVNGNVKKITGQEPITLQQYAKDYRQQWI